MSIQMIQSTKHEQNQRWNVLLDLFMKEFEIAGAVIKLQTVVMELYNRL